MGVVERTVPDPPARPLAGLLQRVCRLAISINIFLVPVAQATVGFGVLVGLLSIPLFLYAFIVSRVDIFDSTNLSIEDLAKGVQAT